MWPLLFAALVLAEPLPFGEALTLAEQVPLAKALEQASARRSELRGELSRMPFNPVLQVQPGYRDIKAGGSGVELYVSIMQRLSVSGLGKKRARSLDAELAHDEALRALARRLARREAASAWLAQWSAQELEGLAARECEGAKQLVRDTERALAAGQATRVDLEQARAFAAAAELSKIGAEGRAFEAAIALTRALGLTLDTPRAVAAVLPEIDLATVPEDRTASTTRSAVVLEAESAQRVETQKLEELTAARRPGMAVGAMGWREGGGDVAGVVTLEVELGIFEHGERERADQSAQVAVASGRSAQAVVNAHAEQLLAAHELKHTQDVLRATIDGSLAAAQGLVDVQHARLQAGEGTVEEWVRARRFLLEAQAAAIEARAAHTLARFVANELFSIANGSTR